MNKTNHRIIFSQSQQQFIIVSELAKSKTPSERRSAVGDCIRFSDGVNINLESVQDTYSNRSDNKNSGWSAGGFIGVSGNSSGIGLEASANKGKGHENSDSVTQKNTVLNTDNLTISNCDVE
ncbi:hemagglutinin repeat-containing protein [Testudinibacter aquarius]|uniref:Type V secretion system putative substrate protein n=1 Tax=Testudinibacter aquarius TaxID=1524974 RepID=A0A4R3Y6D8_9PAST|nr:hemagglutinin repeat-containing protein [Testudinibacter aquarius]KAE9527143.1 hypothetical protein A1D24_12100 [Testudinibacter aquarius]TCV85773.1 type V secretion system putative substrate protein [Testudinibacter aquarius]